MKARYNTYRNTSILDGAGVGCFGLGMKVMVLALFFISFSLLGTELKEFRLLQLEKRGKDGSELYYLKKHLVKHPSHKKPYTGKAHGYFEGRKWCTKHYRSGNLFYQQNWHNNGKIAAEGNWKDGKKQGLWTHWHINGGKAAEQNFKDDIWHGPLKRWYDNGKRKEEVIFKDGAIIGLATNWYENGQQANEINYKVGIMLSVKVWKPNGEKCPNTNLKSGNGVFVIYNDDGTEKIRTTFMDGVMVKD